MLPDADGTVIGGMDTEDKSVREGMVSSQYGREFTGAHYEKIKKVYSIWICMNPPKHRENTITRYRLAEEPLIGETKKQARNYDLISVIMLCLGEPDGENYKGVLRMLGVLLSSEIGEAEKRKILQDDYDIKMTQTMEKEVSVMCNLSKGIIEKGMKQGMERGMEQGMKQGMEQGMKQGIKQGMEQGMKQGMAKGITSSILSSIQNIVKNMGISVEQAMSVLEVPETERQKYMELLEKQ